MLETFIPVPVYQALVARLVEIAAAGPSIFTGDIDGDDFKIALGEVANLWPQSIEEDVRAQA